MPTTTLARPADLVTKAVDVAEVNFTPGERSAVFWISTDCVDHQGDVVLAAGIDIDTVYKSNPIVNAIHQLGIWPIGNCDPENGGWIKKARRGLWLGVAAKVVFDATPDSEIAWLKTKAKTLRGASIGFRPPSDMNPAEWGPPTKDELKRRPDWAGALRVIRRCVLFEWSICGLPMNPECLLIAVNKGMHAPQPDTPWELTPSAVVERGAGSVERKMPETPEIGGDSLITPHEPGEVKAAEPITPALPDLPPLPDLPGAPELEVKAVEPKPEKEKEQATMTETEPEKPTTKDDGEMDEEAIKKAAEEGYKALCADARKCYGAIKGSGKAILHASRKSMSLHHQMHEDDLEPGEGHDSAKSIRKAYRAACPTAKSVRATTEEPDDEDDDFEPIVKPEKSGKKAMSEGSGGAGGNLVPPGEKPDRADEPEADEGEREDRADGIATGDFVKFLRGRKGVGQVMSIHKSGPVPHVEDDLVGTEDEPAARVRLYKPYADGHKAMPMFVGHACKNLKRIDDLKAPTRTIAKAAAPFVEVLPPLPGPPAAPTFTADQIKALLPDVLRDADARLMGRIK